MYNKLMKWQCQAVDKMYFFISGQDIHNLGGSMKQIIESY